MRAQRREGLDVACVIINSHTKAQNMHFYAAQKIQNLRAVV